MHKGHWSIIHRVWSHYTPPGRPNHEVVAEVKRQIGKPAGHTLLLGVTPELANVVPELVAVDWNPAMVANLWRGNTASRQALVANWLNSNFAAASFAACIGDGSLNAVAYPDDMARLCRELARVLHIGAKLVLRVFAAPEAVEDISALRDAAWRGDIQGFHGFKWRLGMAIAGQAMQPNIAMSTVFDVFSEIFPDRERLVAATGWNREEIDTIDYLRGSTAISSFPTQEQLLAVVLRNFANARLISVGSYEVAERCPLLVAERG